jgi:hypothetical protein
MESQMEHTPSPSSYPTNWSVRFLCDCKKQDKEINIHKGIAHDISSRGVHILSDHPICQQKKIAMQLMIPSLINNAPQKIIKVIGKSIDTVMREGKFLTEIEFQYFEEDGMKVLENNLRQRINPNFSGPTAQRA